MGARTIRLTSQCRDEPNRVFLPLHCLNLFLDCTVCQCESMFQFAHLCLKLARNIKMYRGTLHSQLALGALRCFSEPRSRPLAMTPHRPHDQSRVPRAMATRNEAYQYRLPTDSQRLTSVRRRSSGISNVFLRAQLVSLSSAESMWSFNSVSRPCSPCGDPSKMSGRTAIQLDETHLIDLEHQFPFVRYTLLYALSLALCCTR